MGHKHEKEDKQVTMGHEHEKKAANGSHLPKKDKQIFLMVYL